MATFVRYEQGGVARHGEVRDGLIHPLKGTFPEFSQTNEPTVGLDDVKLLAPILPSKIVAIGPGYNVYMQGAPGPERPYYWIKPASALQDPEGDIRLPPGITVNHEAEIAIVIGRRARKVSPDEAMDYVFGYTACNDVTGGDMADRAAYLQTQLFLDGKIFDTFAPLGLSLIHI